MGGNKLSAGAFSHLKGTYFIPLPHPHPVTQHRRTLLLPCPPQVQPGYSGTNSHLTSHSLWGDGRRPQEVSQTPRESALLLLSYYTPHCSLRSDPGSEMFSQKK